MCPMFPLLTDANLINMDVVSKYSSLRTIIKYLGYITTNNKRGVCCVIKWKHIPRYWPFVRGNHRSLVNSPHKGPWRGAFMFSLICAWIHGWVNNREAGDLRRHRANYDVTIMERWEPYPNWDLVGNLITLATTVATSLSPNSSTLLDNAWF